MQKKSILGLSVILLAIIGLFILIKSNQRKQYSSMIHNKRILKDIWMHNDLNSPFVVHRQTFQGLRHFTPNEKYRIQASFVRSLPADTIELITNTGEKRNYLVYGKAEFILDNETVILEVLREKGTKLMFIPFIDATSGDLTYGGGRYLETSLPTGNNIELDFNLAYNPYCAYTEGYSCPLPPKTNVLIVSINAGEMIYGH